MTDFIEMPASKRSLAMRKPIFGVGINDAPYIVQPKINGGRVWCPFYLAWHSMLERCYSKKLHQKHPTYIDCEVAEEWLIFSAFKSWMEKQDWNGMDLDKDIKYIGNKIYSRITCLFVSKAINKLLSDCAASRGKYPKGVHWDNWSKKFQARCSHNGKQKYLGRYSEPELASAAYCKYKRLVILEAASATENYYIKPYLINHANLLTGEMS